jgi:molybdopterin-guanine dinucleotide biosynthesis protein
MRATRVGISGFSSNTGKTTLLCDLLRLNRGWEAIKISRGHYRSCGKDPQACCISPLLGDKPLVLKGRAETYAPGKDTGRYWEAGAGDVQWVICTNDQIEDGVRVAFDRVEREGVLIEGTSFLKYFAVDYAIMVVSPSSFEIKSSAARVIEKIDALFISGANPHENFIEELQQRLIKRGATLEEVSIFGEKDLTNLAKEIKRVHEARVLRACSVTSDGLRYENTKK